MPGVTAGRLTARRSSTVLAFILSALALIWTVTVISPQVYRPLMLLVAVLAIVLAHPCAGPLTGRFGGAVDALVIAATLFSLGWPLLAGEAFLYRAATPSTTDLWAGVIAIAVVIEAARRTTGWILPVVAAAFLVYAVEGPWLASMGMPGLAHRGYDVPRLVGSLFMTLEGIYGIALDVAVSYIILFSIYGAALERSGAGSFFLNFAMARAGEGDAARSAGRAVTLAGFLLGTVSGSGVATTVTLGSVAWPVMRRVGYAADTAGAMLAASGIGALLSPPTLGAAAFLIAEYLRISYVDVLVMATVPTLLYYLSIGLMIEGEPRAAEKSGVNCQFTPDPADAAAWPPPTVRPVEYLHFLSLILVAVLMATGFSAFMAVVISTGAAVLISVAMAPERRLGPRRLGGVLTAGGQDVLSVVATTAVAGIIVGVVTLTGLGLKTAGLIVGLAGASKALTIVFAALAVWILGLAVPVTASYIISAVMVVPALTSVGVPDIAAHMFIFYYAVLSEVSPPTALAPFAAAALTGGRPFRTMMLTWKYALPAFVVPFAFTLDPRGLGLLLRGSWEDAVIASTTAALGVAGLAMGIGGWRIGGAPRWLRAVAAAGGLVLIHPAPIADAAGAAMVTVALFLGSKVQSRSKVQSPS